MKYSVCLLAAGKGTRMQLPYNKVFHELKAGSTLLDASLNLFQSGLSTNLFDVCPRR